MLVETACLAAERYGEQLSDLNHRLWSRFESIAHDHASKKAVISIYQSGFLPKLSSKRDRDFYPAKQDSFQWTYTEFLHAACTLAESLVLGGTPPGKPIITFLGNPVEWTIFLLASARLQVPFLPLDPRSINDSRLLSSLIETLSPGTLVVQDEKSAYEVQKATSHIQHVPAKIICESNQSANGLGKHIIAGWSFLPDLLRSLPSTQSIFPIEGIDSGEKPSLLILTSGTTSEPKVCPHTAANLWSQTTMFPHALQLTSSHSLCFNMPNFHLAGILHVLGMWRAGGTVVILSASFDAEATLDAIERFQVTHMSCVPTIIRALVNHVSFDPSRTKSLRYLHLTATTITPDIMKLA